MLTESEVRDGRLIVRCDDLAEENLDLSKTDTLRAILGLLRDAANVRGVVLVHDRERALGPAAMAVLDALLALGRLLDQFAQRAPAPDFPGFTAKEIDAICARCEFRPSGLFAGLRQRLLGDPTGFLAALEVVATELSKYEEAGCTACTTATVEEIRILIEEMARVPEA